MKEEEGTTTRSGGQFSAFILPPSAFIPSSRAFCCRWALVGFQIERAVRVQPGDAAILSGRSGNTSIAQGTTKYSTTSMSAVANKMAKVRFVSRYAQAMQLAKIPSDTIATPSRCGKSLRTNKSVLGQIRHRESRSPSNASAGSGIWPPQCAQGSEAACGATSARRLLTFGTVKCNDHARPIFPSQNRLGEGDGPQFCSADSAKMGTVPGGVVWTLIIPGKPCRPTVAARSVRREKRR